MQPSQLALAPSPPAPRFLIVEDDEVITEFLAVCLEDAWPGATVTRYDSLRRGRPGADFDWSAHDVLLLDHNLGNGETGVDWLERFAEAPGFPVTLLLTAEDNPRLVGSAVRNGASGYLNKAGLTADSLVDAVQGMIDLKPPQAAPRAAPQPSPPPTPGAAQEPGTDGGDEPPASAPRFRGRSSLDTGPGGASYRFTRLIGRGAMSRVYLAERTHDRTTVVLKILDADVARDPDNVRRFDREGELLAKVDSPYVVRIYDHGATNSYGYIAMEFFGRGDLAQRMAQGVSQEEAVIYLHNIACGLDAIHRLGIVHRDLKAGNVMFRGDGSMALVDFGLSKRVGADASLTLTGCIMGTPYCMSPEQTDGLDADHRSDLYSAGVLFFEMLTGRRPFTGANLPELLLAIQRAPVPRLEGHLARYQPLVDRLLAKSPDDRFQSAAELIAALLPHAPAA